MPEDLDTFETLLRDALAKQTLNISDKQDEVGYNSAPISNKLNLAEPPPIRKEDFLLQPQRVNINDTAPQIPYDSSSWISKLKEEPKQFEVPKEKARVLDFPIKK